MTWLLASTVYVLIVNFGLGIYLPMYLRSMSSLCLAHASISAQTRTNHFGPFSQKFRREKL